MSTLNRRLDALEEIAEAIRLRPFREIAEERGIPLEELMAIFERAKAETAELRSKGLTEDQIIAMKAEQLGMNPAELRREADELLARFT